VAGECECFDDAVVRQTQDAGGGFADVQGGVLKENEIITSLSAINTVTQDVETLRAHHSWGKQLPGFLRPNESTLFPFFHRLYLTTLKIHRFPER